MGNKHSHILLMVMKLKDTYSLEEKLTTNLDGIFKSRDITLPTKVHLVKAMVFPVVMYGKTIALTRRIFVSRVVSLLYLE